MVINPFKAQTKIIWKHMEEKDKKAENFCTFVQKLNNDVN